MGRVMSELVGDLLYWVGLGQVPRQPRSSQTAWGAIVSELCTSDPWQEGAEQAECPWKQIPALGSLKLQTRGTWESTGTVGIGQERCGKLSVPLLLATMCSCYHERVSALEHQGAGAGRSCKRKVQCVCKGQQRGGWAQIPPRLWGLLRAVFSRNGTVSWSKWPQSVGFRTRGQ